MWLVMAEVEGMVLVGYLAGELELQLRRVEVKSMLSGGLGEVLLRWLPLLRQQLQLTLLGDQRDHLKRALEAAVRFLKVFALHFFVDFPRQFVKLLCPVRRI